MTTGNTIGYVAEDLQDFGIFRKMSEMLDFIVAGFEQEFKDVEAKYANPTEASPDVVSRVIAEYGFNYIYDVAKDLNDFDVSILLNFMSLLHFMKGTRAGLELVLEVMGFSAEITEWWEKDPPGEEHTFDMTVFMDLSVVDDVFGTLARVRTFVANYVYPRFELATVVFAFDMATTRTGFAGYSTQVASTDSPIEGTL